jgi:CRP-like cAMP-binding protein
LRSWREAGIFTGMAAVDPVEQYLESIPLFAFVSAEDRPELMRLLRPVELKAGEVLFQQGDPGRAMWVLGKGVEVSVTVGAKGAPGPKLITKAKGGDTLGEMALIDEGRRSGTAVVVQGGPAHQIDAIDFATLREAGSPVVFKILRRLCMELAGKLRATDQLVSKSVATPEPSPSAPGRKATDDELAPFAPFAQLPKVVKLALAQKLTVHDVTGVSPVFSERDAADCAFFVVSGEVTVGRSGTTLATLGPGTMIGLVALLDQGRRSASCITSGPARLLRLSKADFEILFHANNRFAFILVELISRQLVSHIRATNELLVNEDHLRTTPLPFTQPIPALHEEELLEEAEILPLELEMEVNATATST